MTTAPTEVVVDLPALPALVHGQVRHARRSPLRHAFGHRVFLWLVDVDRLPRLPRYLRPFAGFRAADHLGRPDASLRENVSGLLARHGVEVGAGWRIVMLANARVLGHVFDPISVFWVLDARSRLVRIVAEVHNTYGQRHAYVVSPVAAGVGVVRAETGKAMYVSPFNDVSGRYDLRFGLTPESVSASVTLQRSGQAPFVAGFRGRPRPATPAAVVRAQLRHPLMPWRVSLLIKAHGVALWLRRLPVVPRPTHPTQEGV